MSARAISPPPVYDLAMSTSLKPYLELPHLLSLAWVAYPILSLLFVIFRLLSSADSAQSSIESAKENLLASCKAAERAASSTASFPRYMALAANQQFTDAVNGTLNGARAALVLSLTVMEAVINFLVDIYRSTFLCFLELIVRGTLSVLISATQEITNFLQNTLGNLRTSIQNDIASVNNVIKAAVDGINKVNPFADITAPQFTVPSLDGLQNVQIPDDFTQALIKLNSSIPSVAEIKHKLNGLLDAPFELTKKEINDTFNSVSFKPSVFSIPQQSTITFCDQIDTSVIDDLGRDLIKMTKIGIIIIIAVIFLLILANCALEWYKWRCLQNHLEYTRQAWNTDLTVYHHPTAHSTPSIQLTNHNLLTLHGITAHPLLMRIANQISALFRLSPSQHIHTRWFFSYVFHPPALACFLIGFVGLLSVQLQLFALGPIEQSYRNKALSSVNDFSNTIATAMNENMLNQSAVYTSQVNAEVDVIQNTINDGVFGWVNSTTSTLNTTLNNFYGEVQDLVGTVFGGTILEKPMHDFVSCLIGSKVDALSSALTFMHDNLHVDMPRMNQSFLVLSPADVNDVARPVALAAIGSGSGNEEDGGIVGRIVSNYVKALKKERVMFLIFIGIWGIVVLMAFLVIFWHSYLKAWVDQRKKRRWQREQREGFDQIAVRGGHITVTDERSIEGCGRGGMNLPSFTPLASPRPGFLGTLTSPRRRVGSPNNANGLLKPHPHPLGNLDKNYEKSWDSFIDSSRENEKGVSPVSKSTVQFKTTTRGFIGMGIFGRKTMDKEKFVIDTDDEPVSSGNSASASQTLLSVFSRLATLNPFGRKQQDLKPRPISPPMHSSPRPGHRSPPNLSIDIGRATNLKPANLPTIETSSPIEHDENRPTSTWSISPAAPRFPWLATRGSDGSQRSRKPQAVPLRVRNVDPELDAPSPSDNLQEVKAERKPVVVNGPSSHLAPPLHYGYERPVPPEMPRSVSPPPGISSTRVQTQLPARKPSPPPFAHYHVPNVSVVDTNYNFSPGPGRPLHPGLVRESVFSAESPANNFNEGPLVDPFATPFDDSNAVKSQRQPPQRKPSLNPNTTNPFLNAAEAWRSSTNGNPFAPVAL
ncbi:hypothetical protein BDM02DRAFT_3147717 [Thelephora ganbajun]|uniref:Uncharacterized protein n=1 Tax=Thelephora ganbajun TaxID=370292 RepID=A0ACB6Z976_THEGA|nr:hypothetical protein BDM02DRAFT_3147717 [Thelephora ganbajun]